MNMKVDRARPFAVVAIASFGLICRQESVQAQSAPSAINDGLASSSTTTDGTKLSEVIVTAQKRTERLQDVPVPVTAIDAQSLVASNQLRLQDYVSQLPGLSLSTSSSGGESLSIRGI